MGNAFIYESLLKKGGLASTTNRLSVLEVIGNSTAPLTAQDVFETLRRSRHVNRVTVYRILELLVEKKLLERISGGDRAFRYGMGGKAGQKNHPHFFCTGCGSMECLRPESIHFDMAAFVRTFTGEVEKVEVRIDGLCKNCLKMKQKSE
ncbi:transcriptional repressor [Desulfonema ishimotonii]|uniref:Transcriptional repressor n=2 Tax=Desulfonema ishimotonii TaxID=45657 RepID=A0A401FVP0_9BACT|nr:transcriptional repressor [Desulfonema ishimotonii]